MPWEMVGGKVTSPGRERAQVEKFVITATANLLDLAQKQGSWPQSLAEAEKLGLALPKVPADGTLRLDDRQVVVDWRVEAGAPWPLRQVQK
jgi:hypothetical protein